MDDILLIQKHYYTFVLQKNSKLYRINYIQNIDEQCNNRSTDKDLRL